MIVDGMPARRAVLQALARSVLAVQRSHPVRVAVDGLSAAGKTVLGDELAAALRPHTYRAIIRVQIDHFMRATEHRTAYPPHSPESYYLDSWDTEAVRDQLLLPLGPNGSRRYRTATTDARGVPVDSPVLTAADDSILIADGVLLQRPELDPEWDLRIWVDVDPSDSLRRGVARDQAWMGSTELAEHRYRTKYLPGEQRYVDEVRPADRAQLVVDNRDFTAPRLLAARRSNIPT